MTRPQLTICRGAGHLGEAEIGAVGQDRGEDGLQILRRLSGLQMGEVLREAGPGGYLHEQVG